MLQPYKKTFELFVFHRTLAADRECILSGAKGMVVDFEIQNKYLRQEGYNTQINGHTFYDLKLLSEHRFPTICRINGVNTMTGEEIDKAIDAGAREILVPMIRTLEEIDAVERMIDGRAGLGVMIETPEAVRLSKEIDRYHLSRVFVGLNDLQICLGERSIFHLLAAGIVEMIREQITNARFGFGGLTKPNAGYPLPVEYFFNELARLDCDFTFLRRSFFRDVPENRTKFEIPRMISRMGQAMNRSPDQMRIDQVQYEQVLKKVLREVNNHP